ncbi:MAG: adenosylhomocysteinase [Alicyclobacillus herbarius]|uniref:adenosylhomocysteinase n=1 Tax=Alicyclobacillus herbarius TaxID=122960 RepID=UPI0023544F61|nr:adenosylhomocysteinase [Alicyclobacillus herbarius]MCL6634098.1 adenosylhomocysteinase [Alicyclobacillus herbarius]
MSTDVQRNYHVKDLSLAPKGRVRIEWSGAQMPVLRLIRERFEAEKPLKGIRIAACLHVTAETAQLMITLKAGGASARLCASNPLSTQDDVAASLVQDFGIPTFAIRGEDSPTYYNHIIATLEAKPQITMDDGADLVSTLHKRADGSADLVWGGTEETTTGVIRLRSMANAGVLRYPIIAVNEALTKHLFDNRYGTGQSTIDGILRTTNVLMAGKTFVVAGYGWVGRGVAARARGMGANVVVTEVNPVRALEAHMDGYRVMPMNQAAALGDIFVTTTGDWHVIDEDDFAVMKDGAMLANSGHFNVEINIDALEATAMAKRRLREGVDEYKMPDGRRLYLLGEGRLINLAGAEGHPAEVMDMSFADQALSIEYLVKQGKNLRPQVYDVPEHIDRQVASLKLAASGIAIDVLTEDQKKYLASWESGT